MTTIDIEKPAASARAKRLKQLTHATHDRLDQSIMAAEPFTSRERYGLFVRLQHGFHRDIDALYDNRVLASILPDLAGRRRLALIEQDLADLGLAAPVWDDQPRFRTDADIAEALGWLYVAEGSNLGAALLIKEAMKLGLSEEFGARHLAGAPEGRARQWRSFTEALDAIEFDEDDERRLALGGIAAFARVRSLVRHEFAY